MPDQEIENKVKQIIVDELGVDENEVTPNARFIDDLGADSLDTVELVMRFEEEFGIEIPDEDAEKIQSVRDAYNYIDQHKKYRQWTGGGRENDDTLSESERSQENGNPFLTCHLFLVVSHSFQ